MLILLVIIIIIIITLVIAFIVFRESLIIYMVLTRVNLLSMK